MEVQRTCTVTRSLKDNCTKLPDNTDVSITGDAHSRILTTFSQTRLPHTNLEKSTQKSCVSFSQGLPFMAFLNCIISCLVTTKHSETICRRATVKQDRSMSSRKNKPLKSKNSNYKPQTIPTNDNITGYGYTLPEHLGPGYF